ncbi:hypothetical protein O1611_g4345 [Lasiodiplodia mahajangana]|uniref:Uncharacterized protein n=1 Tax=Lasiodiplodia mahajangana TaxID=1108764 RepID=A0ACC2JPA3_9PEZI|nr:hypothetical protein O1611_g4345 [Lasiodiplodia mahajangana]
MARGGGMWPWVAVVMTPGSGHETRSPTCSLAFMRGRQKGYNLTRKAQPTKATDRLAIPGGQVIVPPKQTNTTSRNCQHKAPGIQDAQRNYTTLMTRVPTPPGIQAASSDNLDNGGEHIREAWEKKGVLSIDGGGLTRIYISLLLLRALMNEINKFEKSGDASSNHHAIRPCDYFDYIGGSSTGGLLAIMLGRLRMDVDSCIDEFEAISNKLFSPTRLFSWRWFNRKKFDTHLFEEQCRRVIKAHPIVGGTGDQEESFPSPRDVCQTSDYLAVEQSYLFRTYQNPFVAGGSREVCGPPIWQVARATSAMPAYFKAMPIAGNDFIDGAFMRNNPSVKIYREVKGIAGHVDTLVSLGTGSLGTAKVGLFKPGFFSVIVPHIRTASKLRGYSRNSEFVHAEMQAITKYAKNSYYRFNAPLDRREWRLYSWTKPRDGVFKHLRAIVEEHLQHPDVQDDLRDCARELAERRRLRALDVTAWKKFSA